uniref:Pentatricopeptide repeat protein n=1 Tax=Coccidioides posadasii RMSCC 3488 TaxID=454284 RepID=A0A0J6FJM8_COCPO|nr:hypothetical protein CPAG_06844 [Coccidioides posadasii RMSCC 3488]
MLERAARCIETAGQHIFLYSKSPLRSRRILHSNFWHHGAVDIDIPFWCFGFLYPPSSPGDPNCRDREQRISSNRPASSAHLEFLYPPRTQSFARAYLRTRNLHRSSAIRRRKRFSYRGFASSTDDPDGHKVSAANELGRVSEASTTHSNGDAVSDGLRQLFSKDGPPAYARAWGLFQAAGSPRELIPQMLAYLSTSDRRIDADRTKMLFNVIPISERKAKDYLYAVKTALTWNVDGLRAKDIYNEAVSRAEGDLCWSFAITFLINRQNWHEAIEIWNNRPVSGALGGTQAKSVELPDLSRLPNLIFSFLKAIQMGKLDTDTSGLADFLKFMVYHVVSSRKLIMEMSTKSTLLLLERLYSLQLLEPGFYLKAISTLQSVGLRSASARAIILYRNLRWRLPNEKVSEQLLTRLIKMLSTFEISEGVKYLLDEYRHFHEKPSPDAYRHALTGFARLGKENEVEDLFQSYVKDHGKPSDLKLLSPLLYVHASLGQVKKTQTKFNRLAKDFNLPPNVVCWNILLTAYTRADDFSGALSTFRTMVQNGISPDSHTFGILIGFLANKGDVDAVINLFGIAKQNKVPINSTLVDGVVGALCNNRRYGDAEKVANEALQLNLHGSLTRMWNVLLWNYAFIPDVESVSRIQARMQQEGIEFDGMTYAALMLSLVRLGKLDTARQILGKLHRSRRVHITELHYAILLRGYLKEGNRDMILILYKEMIERFNTLGLSGSLSMLRAYINRDLQRFKENGGIDGDEPLQLPRAERFLDSIMENFDVSMLATKQPQPGAGKRAVREAFPSAYYESLILAYGSGSEVEKANRVLDKYNSKTRELSWGQQSSPLPMLHAQMATYLRQGKHDKVDMCWKKAVESISSIAQPMNLDSLLAYSLPCEFKNPDGSQDQRQETQSNNHTSSILPSYRFALSRCISVLMQSLSYRNLHSKISDIIAEVEKIGFVLTTFNWSLYIKLLCLSRRPADQFRAFTIFEEKFISNFVSWGHIRRGYTKRPDDAPAGLDFLERRFSPLKQYQVLGKAGRQAWARIRPDSMQPTYLTMLYLASALIDVRARSVADGEGEMDSLLSKAPQTVSAVAKLPFLREKFQGIILRGHRNMDDEAVPKPVDTANHVVWTGGILGVDGEPRLDTSPRHQEAEQSSASKSGRPRKSKALMDPGEDTSEPSADLLESIFAEDAKWRGARFGTEAHFEPEPSQQTLDAQDELDLEMESRLEKQLADD